MGIFLSIQELAKRYRVSTKTIYTMKKAGRLPAPLRVGRSVRWDMNDIPEWEKNAKEVK